MSCPLYENLLPPPFKMQVNLKPLLQPLLQSASIKTPLPRLPGRTSVFGCPLLAALHWAENKVEPCREFLSELHQEAAATPKHPHAAHQKTSKTSKSHPKQSIFPQRHQHQPLAWEHQHKLPTNLSSSLCGARPSHLK